MNVIYYNYDKKSDTAEAKYKYDKNSPKLSRAPQWRRLWDERLEVLVDWYWGSSTGSASTHEHMANTMHEK